MRASRGGRGRGGHLVIHRPFFHCQINTTHNPASNAGYARACPLLCAHMPAALRAHCLLLCAQMPAAVRALARCSARAYPQQIPFVSARAFVFPARADTGHAQLFTFSMEYLFFLLCARYCQTCARCGLAVRYFPFHCLQVQFCVWYCIKHPSQQSGTCWLLFMHVLH